MFRNKRLDVALYSIAAVVFVSTFLLARTQTPVGIEPFLRRMISPQSSTILMCEESSITDPRIVSLCDEIVDARDWEIAAMRAILADREEGSIQKRTRA